MSPARLQEGRARFVCNGVTGVVNVDLTPEFAAKLGAAVVSGLVRDASPSWLRSGVDASLEREKIGI